MSSPYTPLNCCHCKFASNDSAVKNYRMRERMKKISCFSNNQSKKISTEDIQKHFIYGIYIDVLLDMLQ